VRSFVVVVVVALVAELCCACSDAITLEIASDRPIPTAIDAICVGVADPAPGGGQFGRVYRVASLPQTLRVEPGAAASAYAWVRGDRGGVPAVRAASAVDFSTDITLELAKCANGPAGAPAVTGGVVGPANARLVASQGASGTIVVAIGATAEVIDVRDGTLVTGPAPAPPAGTVLAVIAADLDGDCDDDLIVATDGAPPALWRRDAATFTEIGALGTTTVAAVAAADVDRDGAVDVITGGGGTLALWHNDGGGVFTRLPASALSGGGRVRSISALALGDLDGDGNPDLVVGQAGDPLVAWLGEPGGTGSFRAADAAVPPVPLDVARLVLADADGDFDPDLAVAVRGAPMRLYIDRDGRLEDQSFVRLPQPAPVAHAIALGGWDETCAPDAVVASDSGGPTLRGRSDALEAEGPAPAATDVVMTDLDDDGDLDAVLAGADGVRWLAR
jgi:hypothetical protein